MNFVPFKKPGMELINYVIQGRTERKKKTPKTFRGN